MRPLNLLIILTASLLLLLLCLLAPSKKEELSGDVDTSRKLEKSSLRSHYSSTLTRSSNKSHILHTPKDGVPLEHTAEHLHNFYLPEIEFRDATLKEAIEKLLYTYETVCIRTGENPIPFHFEVEGEARGKLTLTTSGSFTSILDTIGLYLAMEVSVEDDLVTFIAMEPPLDATVTEENYTVPPNFLNQFSSESTELALQNIQNQLHLEESTVLEFNEARSVLTMRATAIDRARLVHLVEHTKNQRPTQHLLTLSYFTIPTSSKTTLNARMLDTPNLTNSSFGQLTSIDGAKVYEFPSTLSRRDEDALIEIIRLKSPQHTDWEGVKIGINTAQYGFGTHSKINYEQRAYDDPSRNQTGIPITSSTKFNQDVFTYTDGERHALYKTHTADGLEHYIVVSNKIIDAAGKPVYFENPHNPIPDIEKQIIWEDELPEATQSELDIIWLEK